MPMTREEAELVQLLTLQSYDYILHAVATLPEEELRFWVGDAADWVQNREDTAVVTSDAIPVYLDISTGKILVDMAALQALT